MRFKKKEENIQDVDMSPLIDMVFILLIFFMVTTTFQKDMKLELERPSASSASKANSKVVRIYIDKYGDTFIDQQPVKVWAIQGKLRDMLKTMSEKSVLVITDLTVEAQKLIDVVDQCRLSGAKDIAVATNKEMG
jgi:biopolymer transport protein ExbD